MCSPSIRRDQDGVQGPTRISTKISFSDNEADDGDVWSTNFTDRKYSVQKAGKIWSAKDIRMERSQANMIEAFKAHYAM